MIIKIIAIIGILSLLQSETVQKVLFFGTLTLISATLLDKFLIYLGF